MRDIAFYLGMGSLFTHELDAVPNHEWRGLPLLHALSMGQATYEFSSMLSNLLIFGGAAFGALYLLLAGSKSKPAAPLENRSAS